MMDVLILRFEGPLQAWGDVALDPRRPTRAFPSLSGVSGLLASALGWRFRDGDRTTRLQDSLRMAAREDRVSQILDDFQTVDLGRLPKQGWTRWGLERRGGAFSDETHILNKQYLADASFAVAVTVDDFTPVGIDELENALRRPARPLFLGRKSCPPATPIHEGRIQAKGPLDALLRHPFPQNARIGSTVRVWFGEDEVVRPPGRVHELEVWDRRDFLRDRFEGARSVFLAHIESNSIGSEEG